MSSEGVSIRGLIDQWRKQADHLSKTMRIARAAELRLCADELERALEADVVDPSDCHSYLMTHDVDIYGCVYKDGHPGLHKDVHGHKWPGEFYLLPPTLVDHVRDVYRWARDKAKYRMDFGWLKFFQFHKFHSTFWFRFDTFYVGLAIGKTPNDRFAKVEIHLLMAHLELMWDLHPEWDKEWEEMDKRAAQAAATNSVE